MMRTKNTNDQMRRVAGAGPKGSPGCVIRDWTSSGLWAFRGFTRKDSLQLRPHQLCRFGTMLGLLVALLAIAVVSTLQAEDVLIKAKRVITVTGETFEPGAVLVSDGKIIAVGGSIEAGRSKHDRSRHADARSGQRVWPNGNFRAGN